MSGRLHEPSFETLVDWIEGRLDRREAESVSARVAVGDAETKRTIEWIHGFLELSGVNPLPAPPPIVRQRLRQTFERHANAEREVREFLAQIVFDSRSDAELVGVRGVALTDESFHIAYATEAAHVLIDVLPHDDGTADLAGQVVLSDLGPPVFEASTTGASPARASIEGDGHGRFRLDGVPIDTTGLRLGNGEVEIELPIDLRSPMS